jgi:perosamine synthetase
MPPAAHQEKRPSARSDYLAFGRPDFSASEIRAVVRVMKSGWVGMGPEVIAFEQELAAHLGVPHVVTVNSCTSALHLSLIVSGVGPGDEVIVPSLTWCSTANAALFVGAKPVFCDIDPDTLSVTEASIAKRVTARTKAVIAVHFGGRAINVAALRKSLPRHISIVEDAAHAFGATYPGGAKVGTSGHCVCFSFYANKNLSTAEGGAIALTDGAVADRLRSLRQHGLPIDAWKRFSHPKSILMSNQQAELGYKMNFTDLQATIGRVQLRRQKTFDASRKRVAKIYAKGIRALNIGGILQADIESPGHARHLFTVQLPWETLSLDRAQFILAMRSRNLGVTIHYPPLHTMPLYLGGRPPVRLPVAERIAKAVITLPMGPRISAKDAQEVLVNLSSLLGTATSTQ